MRQHATAPETHSRQFGAVAVPLREAQHQSHHQAEHEAEHAADLAADRVLTMPSPRAPWAGVAGHGSAAAAARAKGAPVAVNEVLGSAGQPLDAATRAFMEPRFRHDFGAVRVHADARAQEAARSVDAEAFAVGEHIVFGSGAHASGPRLMAHELAHVVQQRARGVSLQRQKAPAKAPPKSAAAVANDAAFFEWWKRVAGFEGTLAEWKANPGNASDKGGETNFGITKDFYMAKAASVQLDATEAGFAALTAEQAMRFGRLMWKASGADRIKNTGVAMVLADWYWGGVHLKRLTAMLLTKGHKASYELGSPSNATLDFMNTLPPAELVEMMSNTKSEQYRAIAKADPTQQKFLEGWLKRNEERRTQAQPFVAAKAPAGPQVSLWEMGQRALRHANAAEPADRPAAIDELRAAIAAIDQRESTGFAHAEEAVSLRAVRSDLREALGRLSGG